MPKIILFHILVISNINNILISRINIFNLLYYFSYGLILLINQSLVDVDVNVVSS